MQDIDIVREAEEDLKKEKIQKLWDEYKFIIIGAIAALIIGTAIVSFYSSWKLSQDEKATAYIDKSTILADEEALKLLSTDDLPAKQEAIAKLIAVSKALDLGNNTEAQSLLEQVSKNNGADPLLRDMAAVNLAALLLRNDTADIKVVEKTLSPILKDKKNLWYWHALLYQAVAKANLEGDYAAAAKNLDIINQSLDANVGVKQLSEELAHVYNVRAKAAK